MAHTSVKHSTPGKITRLPVIDIYGRVESPNPITHEISRPQKPCDSNRRTWQPPAFAPIATPRAKLLAAARRFPDLQAALNLARPSTKLLASAHGDVLDVGCGAQPYPLPPSPEHPLPRYRQRRRQGNLRLRHPRRHLHTGDRGPIDDASADLILCTEHSNMFPPARLPR